MKFSTTQNCTEIRRKIENQFSIAVGTVLLEVMPKINISDQTAVKAEGGGGALHAFSATFNLCL
jgi:hypothetical protein